MLKKLDRWIKNFIWSGDIHSNKIVTVAWGKVCSPLDAGGLGLRSLKSMNKAALLKLAWEVLSSDQDWATLLRSRFLRQSLPIGHYVKSSIWSGIRHTLDYVRNECCWLIGNGEKVHFWNDVWLDQSLSDLMNIPSLVRTKLNARVADFIIDNKWEIPNLICQNFLDVALKIQSVIIPKEETEDCLVWKKTENGLLTLKDAYTFFNNANQVVFWGKMIWKASIPPSRSFLIWRLLHNRVATDENLQKRGVTTVSICSLCLNCDESYEHLFLKCNYALEIWSWLSHMLKLKH